MIRRLTQVVVRIAAGFVFTAPMCLDAAVCVDPVGVWADGPVKALATRGHLALAGAGPVLMVIDAEDPAHPVLLSQITLPGTILDLAVDDHLVAAALGGHGAALVDITDPLVPSLVAILSVDGFAEAVAAAAEVLAIAVSSGPFPRSWQLDFFDLSELDDPRVLGSIEHPGSEDFYGGYDGVAMDDRFAYWSSGATTLVIAFDDPNGPRLVNQHHHQGFSHCWVAGAAVSDGRLVIAHNWLSGNLRHSEARLGVFSVDSTGAMERIGSWLDEDASWWVSTVMGDRVAIYRYTVDNAILLLSIADPFHPFLTGGLDLHYTAFDQLALGDGSLLASDGDLRIAEFDGPTGLSWASTIDTAGRAVGVTVDKRRAYVATSGTNTNPTSYLHTLDLSRPNRPFEIARAPFSTSRLIDLAVIEDRLVAMSEDNGVVTYDVSNPGSPILEARIDVPGEDFYGQDTLVAGSEVVYALWNGYPHGLDHDVISVLDFSVPSDPVVVNEVAIDAGARGLSIFENLLMVPTSRGMWLFDAAEETAPSLLSVIDDVGSWLRCGAVDGEAAYLGGDDGLYVLDISNPEEPVHAGFIRVPRRVRRLVVSSGFLWVGTGYTSPGNSGDLLVFDIRNPLNPVLVKDPTGPRGMSEVFPLGSHVLVASEYEGLEVFSTRCRYTAETHRPSSEID